MASFLYHAGITALLDGTANLTTDGLRAMLVTSGYSAEPDHDTVSDLTPGSNELSGTGYSRQTLTSLTVTSDNANNRSVVDAADLSWAAINAGTAAAVVLFVPQTTDADHIPFAYIDSGGFPAVTAGGTLTVQWSANGICYF